MSARRLQLGWLPIIQLLLGALLVAYGIWLWYDAKYTAQNIAASTISYHPPRPRPTPPYTFPGGNRTLFPNYRLVALYGSPGAPVLGALGRQDIDDSIRFVKNLSQQYRPYSHEQILPTFEIIATVASESPTENNDYSRQISPIILEQWITAAERAGIYVVLDLQPGRTDFLTQAKQLHPLLEHPNVGLALDPEWRIKPNQKPLVQIGTVSIDEVNRTANWLAALTHTNHLPQKLFLLHQFRLDMIPDRLLLNVSHPELAYAIQMDGQGTQPQKQDTWHALLRQPPSNTRFGWKNFYLKDSPILTPPQTMHITPQPWYISYQ